MSSILEALKKIEQEKTAHEESSGINVSREILKREGNNRKMIRWFWLFGTGAMLVIISLTIALLQKSAPKETLKSGEEPIAGKTAPPPLEIPAQPAAPATAEKVSKPISAPVTPAERVQLKSSQQYPVENRENPLKNEKAALPAAPLEAGEPAKTAVEIKPAPGQQTSGNRPALTLSGIAWNKDSADRLAIINGQPAATGANIKGVIVEEILPDRVKLSHEGRVFELLIGRDAKTD